MELYPIESAVPMKPASWVLGSNPATLLPIGLVLTCFHLFSHAKQRIFACIGSCQQEAADAFLTGRMINAQMIAASWGYRNVSNCGTIGSFHSVSLNLENSGH